MRNFGRALRIALRRKWSITGIILTSILIAVLWGANIGTLYPLVEVVFKGDSLPGYAEKQINQADARIEELDGEIKQWSATLATADEKSAKNRDPDCDCRIEQLSALGKTDDRCLRSSRFVRNIDADCRHIGRRNGDQTGRFIN